jgi:DNA replication protein DnaC
MQNYEHVRDYNREIIVARREKIYKSIPQIHDIDEAVASISVAQARLLIEGDDAALVRLRAKIKELSSERTSLLTKAGFPSDYLEPVYDCSDCKDTGYITGADGLKTKCHCFRRQELSILYEQSHIQNVISHENFSTLSYDYYQGEDLERFKGAVRICRNFVENFKQDYHNILFYGTVGTGKSFLSGCIASELLESGHSVIYFSSTGLFDNLARYTFDTKEKEALSAFYQDLYNCELLIIDDLGTEITNSFVASQLFSCLNERNLRNRSTIISTNLSLEDLRDRYSERVFSRITSSYTICKLTGRDIRMIKKRASNIITPQ